MFLYASNKELIRRVSERPQLPERYRGKPEELEVSIQKYIDRFGEPNLNDYDLAIDVTINSPLEVSKRIEDEMNK